jgi:hypothetical protein
MRFNVDADARHSDGSRRVVDRSFVLATAGPTSLAPTLGRCSRHLRALDRSFIEQRPRRLGAVRAHDSNSCECAPQALEVNGSEIGVIATVLPNANEPTLAIEHDANVRTTIDVTRCHTPTRVGRVNDRGIGRWRGRGGWHERNRNERLGRRRG